MDYISHLISLYLSGIKTITIFSHSFVCPFVHLSIHPSIHPSIHAQPKSIHFTPFTPYHFIHNQFASPVYQLYTKPPIILPLTYICFFQG
ncbi:hypothetical protein EYC84_006447 [Monilinia fructicola]|uniref:Uncharacterized protein n=1 Tax=Monilinia fructicola TaxID=38448 RepID=A0A5M9K3Z8_MONFR|nr:hypothetical protein EYC84_006447 [Monilinia fructicola]